MPDTDTDTAPERMTPDRTGCYVSDVRGRYGIIYMIRDVAGALGFPISPEDAHTLHLAWEGLDDPNGLAWDTIGWLSDEAEAWLNEHVAPEDHAFGWHEGDFILAHLDTWEVIA